MRIIYGILIGILSISCANKADLRNIQACQEFVKDDLKMVKASYLKYAKAEFNTFKLSNFYERSSQLLELDSIYAAVELAISTYDTLNIHYLEVDSDLTDVISNLRNNDELDCKLLFDLNKTFQLLFSQIALVESLYIDSPSIKLFQDKIPTLRKDSTYIFDYGLVMEPNPFNGHIIVLTDQKFKFSTKDKDGIVNDRIEIKMLNTITKKEHIYSKEIQFKIVN